MPGCQSAGAKRARCQPQRSWDWFLKTGNWLLETGSERSEEGLSDLQSAPVPRSSISRLTDSGTWRLVTGYWRLLLSQNKNRILSWTSRASRPCWSRGRSWRWSMSRARRRSRFGWFRKLKISARNWNGCVRLRAEVLEQRDVPLLLARVVDACCAARCRTCRPPGCANAAGLNQKFWSLPRRRRTVCWRSRSGRRPGCTGWPNAASPTPAMSFVRVHRERRAGAQERRAGDLPAAEQRSCSSVVLLAPERQVVDVVEVQHVPAVEARAAPSSSCRRRCSTARRACRWRCPRTCRACRRRRPSGHCCSGDRR